MKRQQSSRRIAFRRAIKIILLAGAILTAGGDAFAFRRGPRGHVHVGKSVVKLPAGHRTVVVRGTRYHYHGGVFYRPGPKGYVSVAAPRGAVVVGLPVGFATVVVAGITYYTFAGVYYTKAPEGYVVVEKPAKTVVIKEVAPVVTPSSPVGVTVAVTVGALNVRTGPGRNHPVSGRVQRDDRLTIRGHAPGWYFVKLPSGRFGWVMKKFTDPMPAPVAG